VRGVDKGGGISIDRYRDLVEDGKKDLEDVSMFEKMARSKVGATISKVEGKLKDMKERGVITARMRAHFLAKNMHEGRMKVNRKVHKQLGKNGRHPTRVYISGIVTPTERIAGLVEKELEEGVEALDSYVQDKADF
jgi:hypothetical protein